MKPVNKKAAAALVPEIAADDAVRRLQQHAWPGNVRELRNLIERTVLLHPGGEITAADFLLGRDLPVAERNGSVETLADVEREHILHVYRQSGQNKSQTADLLGINRLTLRRKLKEYGVG